jgi:cell division protease FtsH
MADHDRRPPNNPRGGPPTGTPMGAGQRRNWLLIVLVLLGIVMIVSSLGDRGAKVIPYSEFKDHVRAGDFRELLLTATTIEGLPREELLEAGVQHWSASRPRVDDDLLPLIEESGTTLTVREESGCGGSMFFLWSFPLLLLMLFFWISMLRRMGGGGPGAQVFSFGKARFKTTVEEGTGVTFADVAGCEEEKKELQEVVEFLAEPERFYKLGAKLPKGVLLVGPPGTGKTLLARALAGEAGVPFFTLSGSDFVEMFVGVGAARVRDLFQQAQAAAPAIIFIDELDAVGKARGAGAAITGNDEREQTLNALLVEMDGFSGASGLIILAATNRPEILDPALLRPGRFDRQILVDRPDIRGREAVLKVHAQRIQLDDDVDLAKIAAQTPGFVGADLANIINEAALLAARRRREKVCQVDLQDAIERVIAGLEKRNRRLNEREKRIVAYHESGHAIVAKALPYSDPVQKVSIIPRGIGALGYTLQVPLDDRYLMTREELLDKIAGLLGGRGAEAVVFGDISTGAQNDLLRCTDIARRMVMDYGMSAKVGSIHFGDGSGQPGLPPGWGGRREYSEQTAEQIDREVAGILRTQLDKVIRILELNRSVLEEMAQRLLEVEVMDGDDLGAVLGQVKALSEDEQRRALVNATLDATRGAEGE